MLSFCYVSKILATTKEETMYDNVIQFNLRIPKDLKDYLAEQAKKDGRSLNNFMVKSLQEMKLKQQENAKA